MGRLKGVTDPEKKRKIIGDEFAKVFVGSRRKRTGRSSGSRRARCIRM